MSQPITHDTQRLVDLVRYCRGYLHDEGLITGDEYAVLVEVGSDAARRLESYDEVRARLAALEAERAALVAYCRRLRLAAFWLAEHAPGEPVPEWVDAAINDTEVLARNATAGRTGGEGAA